MSTRKPENTFIASVHRHLGDDVYTLKNDHSYVAGVADVWYSMRHGRDMWIEYKFIEVPKRADTVIDLITPRPKTDSPISALQQRWLTERHVDGRAVGVIVGSKDGGVLFTDMTWKTTFNTRWYLDHMLSRKELASWIEELLVK